MSVISRMEQALRLRLLPELGALYGRADGEPDELDQAPMRLMSAAEVIEAFNNHSSWPGDFHGSAAFFVGWNGDCTFVYLTGPLVGHVYFLDHEGRGTSVAYRSVSSFLEVRAQAVRQKLDWHEMPTDYFIETAYYFHGLAKCRPAGAEAIASDLAARQELRRQYVPANVKDELDDQYFAFNIMALTPPSRTEEVMPFLSSKDMWIQARACDILAHRRYEPAVDRLAEVARNGTANGRGAARRALQRIGSEAAQQWLRKLGDEM